MPDWLCSSKRRYSSLPASAGARAVLADLEHADQVGGEQRRQRALQGSAKRLGGSRLRGLESEAVERTVLVSPDVRCRAQWECAFPKKGVSPVIGVPRGTLRKVLDGSAGAGVLGAEVFELFGVGPGRRRLVGGRAVVGARCLGPALGRCPRASSAACVSGVAPDASGAGVASASSASGVSVGVGVGVGVVAGARPSPLPGTSSGAGSPGTSWTATVAPPQPARANTSMEMGTASRGAKRMRPPLSGAARPSGGRTSGSR